MQFSVDDCNHSRSRVRDCLMMSGRMNIDKNVSNNGQPTDNTRVIIVEENCTSLQVQMAVRNGQSRLRKKRPIKNISPADKVGAIDRVHDGESKASVARDIGIPESALRGWCKSEHKIRSQCNSVTIEKITRHCPISIGNCRAMSANDQQLVSRWDSSNNRQLSDIPSDDEVSVAKKAKVERTNRQNNSQNVMPVPSTSSANNMSHGINPNYTALIASSMANSITAMSLHEQYQMCAFLTTLKEIMLQHNNPIALVEDGLCCTEINNTLPTRVYSSTTTNNTAVNIRDIGSVHSTMGNMIDNVMKNPLNYIIGNKNIVAATQSTTSSYTQKSSSVTSAEEAPTIVASASPHENNVYPREIDNGDVFWT